MATMLVTGATGTVGRAMVPALKARGHRLICLVRGPHAPTRLRAVLGRHLDGGDLCWTGDVAQPLAGLSRAVLAGWRGRVDHVLHLAGSVEMGEAFSARAERVNVGGVRNLLDVAEALGRPVFHHMSTAYVAGDLDVLTEDDGDVGQRQWNAYARTKLAAEKLVEGWDGPRRIYRMSVMVGETVTGEIADFNGYYGFVEPFWRLRNSLWRRWARNPASLRRHRIVVDDEGLLTLPLVVRCSLQSTLNLISADWLAETTADLVTAESPRLRFHLVRPDPPPVRWYIERSLAHIGVVGLRYGRREPTPEDAFLLRLQRGVDRGLKPLLPYVTHGPRFTCDHLREALGGRYAPPPPLDEAALGRILDYAEVRGWGAATDASTERGELTSAARSAGR